MHHRVGRQKREGGNVPGLERLKANKADALAQAARALDEATRASKADDYRAASDRVRAGLDTADDVVRVLAREGEA